MAWKQGVFFIVVLKSGRESQLRLRLAERITRNESALAVGDADAAYFLSGEFSRIRRVARG
jgi:hypothetical protein